MANTEGQKTDSVLYLDPVVESQDLATAVPPSWYAAEASTWTIELDRPDDESTLGLELDIDKHRNVSVKREPRDGPARAWNDTSISMAFKVGDIVESVNGVTGEAASLLKAMKGAKHIKFGMKRMVDFKVTIEVEEGLGLRLINVKSRAFVDKVIPEGDVDVYNATCAAGYRVARGIWLISVDGWVGEPDDIKRMISQLEPGKVELRFGRPHPDGASQALGPM